MERVKNQEPRAKTSGIKGQDEEYLNQESRNQEPGKKSWGYISPSYSLLLMRTVLVLNFCLDS
jgi:hypothetical protein